MLRLVLNAVTAASLAEALDLSFNVVVVNRAHGLLRRLPQHNVSEVSCEQCTPVISDERAKTALHVDEFEADCTVRQLDRAVMRQGREG